MATDDKAASDKAALNKPAAPEIKPDVKVSPPDLKKLEELVKETFSSEPAGPDFTFTGTPGGQFHIEGNGFSVGGTVCINGVQVVTTSWGANRIEGVLPSNVVSGEVTVQVDSKTVKYGCAQF